MPPWDPGQKWRSVVPPTLRTLVGIGQRLGIEILVVDEDGVQDAKPWGARLEVDADGTLAAASPDEVAARLGCAPGQPTAGRRPTPRPLGAAGQ